MRRLIAMTGFLLLALFVGLAGLAVAEDDNQFSIPGIIGLDLKPEESQPLLVAQQRRRTLMDLLFGNPEEQAPPPAAPIEEQAPAPRPQQSTPQAAAPPAPPPVPEVSKAEGATRLAVIGDSLAVDLGRALERFYAEDPNLQVIPMGVGSSGLVRDDFYDWSGALEQAIADDTFDLAVIIMGINDRQPLTVEGSNADPLTDPWKAAYSARVNAFLGQLRAAGKPAIWVGLPPMEAPTYSQAMNQISSLFRLSSVSAGAEFVDIYERFIDDAGAYSAFGPDLNGQRVQMRKSDGIHFSSAGSDKLAFYVSQAVRNYYRGGGLSIEIADILAGTDAQTMLRPPYQGVGQIRMLEVAGAVISLNGTPDRATDLMSASAAVLPDGPAFDLDLLVMAPPGRIDAFGVGISPAADIENPGGR